MAKDINGEDLPGETLTHALNELRDYTGLPEEAVSNIQVRDLEHKFSIQTSAEIEIKIVESAVKHGTRRYKSRAEAKDYASKDMDTFVSSDWSRSALAHPRQTLLPKTPDLHYSKAAYAHHCTSCDGQGQTTCSSCRGCGEVNCSGCHGLGWYSCSCGNGYQNCVACSGQGTQSVSRTVYKNSGSEAIWVTERCGYCSGSGDGFRCNTCNATGRAPCIICRGDKKVTCNGCSGGGAIGCNRCGRTGVATSEIELAAYAKISTEQRFNEKDPIQRAFFPSIVPVVFEQAGFHYTRHAVADAGRIQSVLFSCLAHSAVADGEGKLLAMCWGEHNTIELKDDFKALLWNLISARFENPDYHRLNETRVGRDLLACGVERGSRKEAAEARLDECLPKKAQECASTIGSFLDRELQKGDTLRGFWLTAGGFVLGAGAWAIESADKSIQTAKDFLETKFGLSLMSFEVTPVSWFLTIFSLALVIYAGHLWATARRRKYRFRRLTGNVLDGKTRLRLPFFPAASFLAMGVSIGVFLGPSFVPALEGGSEQVCSILKDPAGCIEGVWDAYTKALQTALQ